MPQPQAKALVTQRKKGADAPTKNDSRDRLGIAKATKKWKSAGSHFGGGFASTVDPGSLVNIASTVDPEVAIRAARRAGILTATGKLSRKYR